MHCLLSLLFVLLFCACGSAQAAPYTPQSDAEILERLPFKASDAEGRELRQMRRALAEQPQDLKRALALAQRYFDLASAEGDPRYVGYAEAAIRPWSQAAEAPVEILVMHALLRQYRHEFDAALADLARAAERDPGNARVWSWRRPSCWYRQTMPVRVPPAPSSRRWPARCSPCPAMRSSLRAPEKPNRPTPNCPQPWRAGPTPTPA